MRGDRPDISHPTSPPTEATPHARGSTAAAQKFATGQKGYPACAGIDREPADSGDDGFGLPRMRGDRPGRMQLRCWASMATPHARGSTLPPCRHRLPARGYPACAGIDPSSSLAKWNTLRLPRMRGDRPGDSRRSPCRCQATPHARGSTCLHRTDRASRGGYPACAGIDLPHAS